MNDLVYLILGIVIGLGQLAMLLAFFRLCADVAALRKSCADLAGQLAGWLPRLERAVKPPAPKPASKLDCPHCGGALAAAGLRAGHNECPHCGESFDFAA